MSGWVGWGSISFNNYQKQFGHPSVLSSGVVSTLCKFIEAQKLYKLTQPKKKKVTIKAEFVFLVERKITYRDLKLLSFPSSGASVPPRERSFRSLQLQSNNNSE